MRSRLASQGCRLLCGYPPCHSDRRGESPHGSRRSLVYAERDGWAVVRNRRARPQHPPRPARTFALRDPCGGFLPSVGMTRRATIRCKEALRTLRDYGQSRFDASCSGVRASCSGVDACRSGARATCSGVDPSCPGAKATYSGVDASSSEGKATCSGVDASSSEGKATYSGVDASSSEGKATYSGVATSCSGAKATCSRVLA